MKILIVEDEEGLREALIRTLTGEGYLADGAADGEEGYQLPTAPPSSALRRRRSNGASP